MNAPSLMTLLADFAEFWSAHTPADVVAARLGAVEPAPAARSLRVVRPSDPAWARAQVAVDEDGSAPWVSLDPADGFSLTLDELHNALGEPSEIMRIYWNEPERVKFRYQRNRFCCSVIASLGDDVDTGERCIVEVLVYRERPTTP